jgi:hypothetical protein
LATFLLFLCKKDDKKHSSERFFYGESINHGEHKGKINDSRVIRKNTEGKLTTESTEKALRAQSEWGKKNTEMLLEHGNETDKTLMGKLTTAKCYVIRILFIKMYTVRRRPRMARNKNLTALQSWCVRPHPRPLSEGEGRKIAVPQYCA